MGLMISSRLLGSAIFPPGYHASWESVAVFGIVFTSTSNRWNCDRLRRLRERSMRHRRHRAIFSSISDLNAPICALNLKRILLDSLGTGVTVVDEVSGFRYFDARDLLGFVDGTANPTSLDLPASALVGDEDADFVGGSYVVVQKYLHDLSAWAKIPTPLQEEIIGRTKIDNIEIDDDDAPRKSHKSLATIVDAGGKEYDILRDNMPFGRPGQREFGTYFIGYSRYLWVIEKMLQRMYVGDPPGAYDRLLDFSTPHTGTTFFAPSRPTLQKLAQAAHAKLTAPTP